MLALLILHHSSNFFFFWRGGGTEFLTAPTYWPVLFFVFFFVLVCFFAVPNPLSADLCPELPPLLFSFAFVCCNALAVGSHGNVTLWGTCGWWVAFALWLAAFLGVGAWHVSPRKVAFGLCMMTVSLPVLFFYVLVFSHSICNKNACYEWNA